MLAASHLGRVFAFFVKNCSSKAMFFCIQLKFVSLSLWETILLSLLMSGEGSLLKWQIYCDFKYSLLRVYHTECS